MSRTLKYLLTIVLIIAAAMWLMTVYRSCEANKSKTETSTSNLDTSGSETSSTSGEIEDLYQEDEEDENATGEDELDGASALNDANDNGATDEDGETSEYEADDDVSIAGDGINKNGGEYLVVAGAFVSKRNAKAFQKQLERRDFDSEIRVFLGSDYHSVIMGNYISRSEATAIAKKIGGEAYVHKKRYPKKRKK